MRELYEAVFRMRQYIHEHLQEETLTLETISKASHYSPWYAHRLFTGIVGMPPAEYIRRLRLSKSALLLRDGKAGVTDAAFACGFGSAEGFQRAFFREFGINPGEYAKRPVLLHLFTPELINNFTERKKEEPMYEIVNVYREPMPACRFIGKMYGDSDRDEHGSFMPAWNEFIVKNRFTAIEEAAGGKDAVRAMSPDGDSYIGLMRWAQDEPFQYWIGLFVPAGTPAPEGLAYVDFNDAELGTCWVRGMTNEVFGHEDVCARKLMDKGWEIASFPDGSGWFFERYGTKRFTSPDPQGQIILDICHFLR